MSCLERCPQFKSVLIIFQNIGDELKLATEGFFESESLIIDPGRREVLYSV